MPNTLTPTGPFSKPFLGAAKLLAASSTFQTTVGAANAAAALNFIHWPRILTPNSLLPIPCALIGFDESCSFHLRTISKATGSLVLALLFAKTTTYTRPEDILFEYTNQVGLILREMQALANTSGPDGHYWNLCGDDSPIENLAAPTIIDGNSKEWSGTAANSTGEVADSNPTTFLDFCASEWLLPWQQ
jgi:hypothetical protein